MALTDAQLIVLAEQIRDEVALMGNTKVRVYNILKEIIQAKSNNLSVTISSAQIINCGTSAVSIIAAPGANKFISFQKLTVKKKAGVTPFDFTSNIIFKTAGGDVTYLFSGEDVNSSSDLNLDMVKQGQKQISNAAFIMTTEDGSNASAGNGDLDISIQYLIEDANV